MRLQARISLELSWLAASLRCSPWGTPNKVGDASNTLVQLQSANMNADNVYVSQKATITLETFKKTNSNPSVWSPNMCFEL